MNPQGLEFDGKKTSLHAKYVEYYLNNRLT